MCDWPIEEEGRTWYGLKNDKIVVFLTYAEIPVQKSLQFVKHVDAGAVVYFGGTTRETFEGREVVHLEYEAHIKMALKTLRNIATNITSSSHSKIHRIVICHRLGVVPKKEESVLVALSSTHREEGWRAAEGALEDIKKSAEIWKKEQYLQGHSWKGDKVK
ncbi:BA75_01077T0 [Komagataella pastoris]|uniref:BA75_01077T0 n=1 Tax=Komagataella pastoris TaxID=4922 RepID=A0A1B2J7A1_PICPA|nr:BA75_01077T0 [Komagataella pastoris]